MAKGSHGQYQALTEKEERRILHYLLADVRPFAIAKMFRRDFRLIAAIADRNGIQRKRKR